MTNQPTTTTSGRRQNQSLPSLFVTEFEHPICFPSKFKRTKLSPQEIEEKDEATVSRFPNRVEGARGKKRNVQSGFLLPAAYDLTHAERQHGSLNVR